MTTVKDISLEDWTLEKIKELSFQEQMELYKTLPSADFEEMDGDYDSCMVGFTSEMQKEGSLWWLHKSEKGNWMGKSFSPTKGTQKFHSEGYNRWEIDGKEVHHMRFHTVMVESLIDGKITFRLKYARFKNDGGIVDMTDEVRRIRKGFYLCVGMADPVKLPPDFFCLTGPVHEYDHSSVWIYGDETEEHASIKVTPYAEWLKKQK
ncbi:hypothetical protein LCGC14_0604080 [marine sediment metagenome]|uniref:Uncharacterized protein n=1 Tax=marine sediment metagenome TaxID=412755 RepID=A0A0F9REJ3_9ZZZZ|nr:MAG: hypothetical protein Lokiarch_36380 [Candidatus Lokiarchaeum sp. GC14_75]